MAQNTLRTFIAVEINADLRRHITEAQDYLKKLNVDVRWVKPQNIHLTLKFLGDTEESKIDDITKLLKNCLKDFKPFEMKLTHLGAFPREVQPKVLWVGTETKEQVPKNVASLLNRKLQRLGFKKEKRSFSPHITLGRVRSSKNQNLIAKGLRDYALPEDIKQTIRYVTLFKSTLTSEGPIYESLAQVNLE